MAVKANATIDLNALKVAGANATGYITDIDSKNGITIKALNGNTTTGDYIKLNTEGLQIFRGGTPVALYSDSIIIGNTDFSNIELTDSSIRGRGLNGIDYFNFTESDASISTTINEPYPLGVFPTQSNPIVLPLNFTQGTLYVTSNIAGQSVNNYPVVGADTTTFSYGVQETQNRTIELIERQGRETEDYGTGTVTYIYNSTNKTLSIYSSDFNSLGFTGTVRLTYTETRKAPGYLLGSGVASGGYSLATGYNTTASGNYSLATGYNTTAGSNYQTVIGKYNQNKTTTLFEIGKGTSSSRSNAFEVDTSGNVNIASGAKYKINGNAITASDVGAVPTTRTVNSKALSSDISLTASDVSAVPTSDVSTTGGANKVIKSDSSGNIVITGNLTLSGHTTPIGSTLTATNSAQKSISADGSTTLATLSNLPVGTWVIECNIRFSNTANGIRRGGLLASGSSLGTSNMDFQVGAATTAAFVKQTFTKVITTTAITTYNLIGYSSVAVTVGAGEANIKAVRLC